VQAASGFERSGFGRILGGIRRLALLAAALSLHSSAQRIRMRAF
jgi:hypothetical protein